MVSKQHRSLRFNKKEHSTMTASVPALSQDTTLEGHTFNLGDHSARCILGADATDGALSLFEVTAEPGGGTPPHRHQYEDEIFYVLEGALAVMQEGSVEILTAGQCAFAGRGKVHAWKSVGSTTARAILTVSPGGFETFFSELESIFADHVPEVPGSDVPDPEVISRIDALMTRFGMTLSLPEPIK
jgi:quercetin dioxygenase-like cupin family protein